MCGGGADCVVMIGQVAGKITTTPLEQVVTCHKGVDLDFYNLAQVLEFASVKPFQELAAMEEANTTVEEMLIAD